MRRCVLQVALGARLMGACPWPAELAAATCAPLGWHRAATDRPAGGRGFSALPEASPLGAFVSSAHLARADEASTGELAAAGHAGHAAAGPPARQPRRQPQTKSVDDFMGATIAGATMLGQLRRLMLRYRAMLLPPHVVDILVAMERICSRRAAAAQSPPPPGAAPRGAAGGVHSVRVQSAALPAAAVNLDSQGPERQAILYMMGDLGNMLWGHLDEIDAAGLANCIWAWARLSWHPEPQLLSEVARRFVDAALAAPLPPCALARGVWGLGALDALGASEADALAPRLREVAVEVEPSQLKATARALAAAAAAGGGSGGGGATGGEAAAAIAAELAVRADRQLRGGRGGSG
ncbi:hypothetical protein Rsub_01197 [Raphidocelis subcapitata]|uniref:Uncharacterized protein n=1 Tax=Raphidocelis subcapitata TaxID=307507 RepID=A0A2V0NM06_9CHLO|nr:hypothetical protein Rsub_01197 [Raphidocelis subcapitata]|eukprot:GBF88484.1 hypothetical protein Rsub_01197 [Raphidocelis subcapitata]